MSISIIYIYTSYMIMFWLSTKLWLIEMLSFLPILNVYV